MVELLGPKFTRKRPLSKFWRHFWHWDRFWAQHKHYTSNLTMYSNHFDIPTFSIFLTKTTDFQNKFWNFDHKTRKILSSSLFRIFFEKIVDFLGSPWNLAGHQPFLLAINLLLQTFENSVFALLSQDKTSS